MAGEMEKDAGLIERKRQGQGKPTMIFAKKFIRIIEEDRIDAVPDFGKVEGKDTKTGSQELAKSEFWSS